MYQLEYYWRYKTTHPIHQKMHRMIESVLVSRAEKKTYSYPRLELINYLDKCWSISNPMARLSLRLIGYMSQFVERKANDNLD